MKTLIALPPFHTRNHPTSLAGQRQHAQPEYADIIAKEVGRLEGILIEILSFVKDTRIIKETVNANKLVDEIVSLIESEIDEKNIFIIKELGNPVDIFVDPNRIKDAFFNILRNAVQAVESNGTVSVKTYSRNSTCVFEFRDSGPGISEADLPFIFDPFFTTKKAGTGLGLTITHRIVEEHRGSIEVKSKAGAGSTFRVLIPVSDQ